MNSPTEHDRYTAEDPIPEVGHVSDFRPDVSHGTGPATLVTLQDRTGVIEALVFPEAFQKLEPILKAATPLLVKARVAVEDVGTRLIVADAKLLDQVSSPAKNGSPTVRPIVSVKRK